MADRLFNGAMHALAGFTAGLAYVFASRRAGMSAAGLSSSLSAHGPSILTIATMARTVLPFGVAAVVYALINSCMIRLRLRLDRPRRQAGTEMAALPLLASDLVLSAFGLIIATLWPVIGVFTIVVVLVPLGVARWAIGQFAAQQRAHEAALATWCQAVQTKDPYTRDHGDRVSQLAGLLARQLGIGTARLEAVQIAGLLHDVGKIGVPTQVLQKDGPVTDEEAAAIQSHPRAGLTMVGGIAFLEEALGGIMHHHERMDGRGYPMGLAGEEIPEFARIIAVADAFDAMTTRRSYRHGLHASEAVSELRKCAGSQFDPVMVEAFIAGLSGSDPQATGG